MPPVSDRHIVRQFLRERFPSEEEFDAFCAAWFQDVAEQFSSGMDRILKTDYLFSKVEPDVILECVGRMPQKGDETTRPVPEIARQRVRAEAELQTLLYHKQVLEQYGGSTESITEKIKSKQSELRSLSLYPGLRIDDKYVLIEKLGEGSLGSVWHARSLGPSLRYVAIKVAIGKALDSDVARLARSATVLGRLAGKPHVVSLVEGPCQYGTDHHYMVMEYLPGGSLQDRLRAMQKREAGFLLDDDLAQLHLKHRALALKAILQIGEALTYAHSVGTIHRNIHPGNIMFDGQGSAKITDFDSTRTSDKPRGDSQTLGILRYRFSAPEKRTGTSTVDARSDVYSLAMVTIIALAMTQKGVRLDIGQFDPSREDVNALIGTLDIPRPANELLHKAIAAEPDKRVKTMKEFCAALQSNFQKVIEAGDAIVEPLARKPGASGRFTPAPAPASDPASTSGSTALKPQRPGDPRRTTLKNFPFRVSSSEEGGIEAASQISQPPSAVTDPTAAGKVALTELPPEGAVSLGAPVSTLGAAASARDAQSWADLVVDDAFREDAVAPPAPAPAAPVPEAPVPAPAPAPSSISAAETATELKPLPAETAPAVEAAAPAAVTSATASGKIPAGDDQAGDTNPMGAPPAHTSGVNAPESAATTSTSGPVPAPVPPTSSGPTRSSPSVPPPVPADAHAAAHSDGRGEAKSVEFRSSGPRDSAMDTAPNEVVYGPRGSMWGSLRSQVSRSPLLALSVVIATVVNLSLLGIILWLVGRVPQAAPPSEPAVTAQVEPPPSPPSPTSLTPPPPSPPPAVQVAPTPVPVIPIAPSPALPSAPLVVATDPVAPAPMVPAAPSRPGSIENPARTGPAARKGLIPEVAPAAPPESPVPSAPVVAVDRPASGSKPVTDPTVTEPKTGKDAPRAGADPAAAAQAKAAKPTPKPVRQVCVASDPGLADVFIDNKPNGKTPGESSQRCINVPGAKFQLRLKRDGYKPFVFSVTRDSAWLTQRDKDKNEKQVIVITPKLSAE